MAIRIRSSNDITIALCAVESDPMLGDIYLDDAAHYALAAKFAQDKAGKPASEYPEEWAEMAKHKTRDAETELNKWLDAQAIETQRAETA
jgi:hypothetical protein